MENTRRKRYNSCSMPLIPPAAMLIRTDYPSAKSVQTVTLVHNCLINVATGLSTFVGVTISHNCVFHVCRILSKLN